MFFMSDCSGSMDSPERVTSVSTCLLHAMFRFIGCVVPFFSIFEMIRGTHGSNAFNIHGGIPARMNKCSVVVLLSIHTFHRVRSRCLQLQVDDMLSFAGVGDAIV